MDFEVFAAKEKKGKTNFLRDPRKGPAWLRPKRGAAAGPGGGAGRGRVRTRAQTPRGSKVEQAKSRPGLAPDAFTKKTPRMTN